MRVMVVKNRIKFRPHQRPDSSTYSVEVSIFPGEHVLLVGSVDNIEGTVAVSTWDGNVLWPIKMSDLEELDEHLPPGQGPGQVG